MADAQALGSAEYGAEREAKLCADKFAQNKYDTFNNLSTAGKIEYDGQTNGKTNVENVTGGTVKTFYRRI